MDTAVMKDLLDYKDKIKASQAKRDVFAKEWQLYVSKNGFDETAEQYLFSGFEYRRMHPFVDYLKTVDNKKDIVLRFLNGKQFSKVKPKSFKMALNLLAILFAELPEEHALMTYLIRRLPSVSYGKDKKRSSDTGKAFEKFFFPEIADNTVLPDLHSFVELKAVSINEFRTLVCDALGMISEDGEISPKLKNIYVKTETWNKGQVEVDNTASETVSPDNTDASDNQNNTGGNTHTEAKDAGKPADKVPEISWKSSLKFVSTTIERFELQVKLLQEQLQTKDREIADVSSKLAKKETDYSKSVEEVYSLRAKEIQLSRDISNLKSEIESLNMTIQQKDKEIVDRRKLAEMLSRDTSKQSDAVLKRLSSALSSYYSDYMAAKDEEVTPEIGYILKDQLSEIFAILKKNGISLQ